MPQPSKSSALLALGEPEERSSSKQSATRQHERGSSKETTRSGSKQRQSINQMIEERQGSKERHPSKEKHSRSNSKASTEAPQDSPSASSGELAPLKVVRRASLQQRRSTSLPGPNEDCGFAPGDKVIFVEYDAIADSFGIGHVTALGEKPGIVRVKFEKQEQTYDFKTDTLKKCTRAEENHIKHGSAFTKRHSIH
jgi:hypothetical protein